ncbi:MBL fold metallo-hydrolase [Halorarum salinum]|uniref:MBL fold metallo-hydrolase n=1 Tax=Halorarum salinum TaxID=2743089 RepID=A0A7D5Q9Q6_9EURY|nr:MBL fold metallo-hydrolase [Halobaculum salinum]QLG61158.1 MBL fold metallo-hydrolase [Halobaculum salinum]
MSDTTTMTAGKHLRPDVQWINECYELDGKHEHVSVYLIEEDGEYILVDSGSFYHRDAIESRLEEATDGAGIDALVLSHSDYPHSANVSTFRSAWGDVELVASSGAPEVQGLSDAKKCEIGGSMTIRGRTFSFIDPPLADRSHTTWIYDHGSEIIFAADGFGNHHSPGECNRLSTDFEDSIRREDIYTFHEETLVWLRYVDPVRLREVLESMLSEYEPSYVAPIHGNPIAADHLDTYLDRLIDSAERIESEYDVGGKP